MIWHVDVTRRPGRVQLDHEELRGLAFRLGNRLRNMLTRCPTNCALDVSGDDRTAGCLASERNREHAHRQDRHDKGEKPGEVGGALRPPTAREPDSIFRSQQRPPARFAIDAAISSNQAAARGASRAAVSMVF
jgi:hypothetical protein